MILIFLARFASLTGVEKSELFTFLRAIVGFLPNIIVRLLFRSDSFGFLKYSYVRGWFFPTGRPSPALRAPSPVGEGE